MTPEELVTQYSRYIPQWRVFCWQIRCFIDGAGWVSARAMRKILAEQDIEHFVAEDK